MLLITGSRFAAQSAAPHGDAVSRRGARRWRGLTSSPREDIVARHLKVAQGMLDSPVAERALIELVNGRA